MILYPGDQVHIGGSPRVWTLIGEVDGEEGMVVLERPHSLATDGKQRSEVSVDRLTLATDWTRPRKSRTQGLAERIRYGKQGTLKVPLQGIAQLYGNAGPDARRILENYFDPEVLYEARKKGMAA